MLAYFISRYRLNVFPSHEIGAYWAADQSRETVRLRQRQYKYNISHHLHKTQYFVVT